MKSLFSQLRILVYREQFKNSTISNMLLIKCNYKNLQFHENVTIVKIQNAKTSDIRKKYR